MPKMTMTKASKGNAKQFPVKVTTMDAELEFTIEVSISNVINFFSICYHFETMWRKKK